MFGARFRAWPERRIDHSTISQMVLSSVVEQPVDNRQVVRSTRTGPTKQEVS